MDYRYVFGPVMSGRLGLSLGLDLLGRPVCSMDCVYCEVGATTELTLARRPWVRSEDILRELAHWAAQGHQAEIVTLGGSGEPCLNTELPGVIAGVHRILPGMPVAVLTNSTLMGDPQVRSELAGADVVLPSLDSLVPEEFRRINRCAPGVGPQEIAAGLLDLRREFSGLIHLEILLVQGINDTDENLRRMREFVAELAPQQVDVTTLSRPGTQATARAVDPATLAAWREALGAAATDRADTAARAPRKLDPAQTKTLVSASLARRPQTVLQLATALGTDEDRVRRAITELEASARLITTREGDQEFHALRREE